MVDGEMWIPLFENKHWAMQTCGACCQRNNLDAPFFKYSPQELTALSSGLSLVITSQERQL